MINVASSTGKKSKHVIRILLELTKRQFLWAGISLLFFLIVNSYKLKFVSAHLEFMPCIRSESIIFILLHELNCCYPVFQMWKSVISVNVCVSKFVFQQSGLQVWNHAVQLKGKGISFPPTRNVPLLWSNFPFRFCHYYFLIRRVMHLIYFTALNSLFNLYS